MIISDFFNFFVCSLKHTWTKISASLNTTWFRCYSPDTSLKSTLETFKTRHFYVSICCNCLVTWSYQNTFIFCMYIRNKWNKISNNLHSLTLYGSDVTALIVFELRLKTLKIFAKTVWPSNNSCYGWAIWSYQIYLFFCMHV